MNKQVIAVITGSALSSGYYVASGTEKIYADSSATIGNLGNTFAYVNRLRNGQEQVCYVTSSNYKNIKINDCLGFEQNVFDMLKNYVGSRHEILVNNIAQIRNLSVDEVKSLDNTTMISYQALKLGLVDEIGTTSDAINWLQTKLGVQLYIINLRDIINQKWELTKYYGLL